MKNNSLIIAFLFILISVNCCLAQEWDSIMDSYSKNQIERPVTPQEFNQALETVQSFQKKPKEKKKKNKKKSKEEVQKISAPQPPVQEEMTIPPSSGLLLRLPISVHWHNIILPDGFYLVEKIIKDKGYFLKIKQSGKNITELPAIMTTGKYTGFAELSVHSTKNSVEIIYTDKESCIKAELPIYIPSLNDNNDNN